MTEFVGKVLIEPTEKFCRSGEYPVPAEPEMMVRMPNSSPWKNSVALMRMSFLVGWVASMA